MATKKIIEEDGVAVKMFGDAVLSNLGAVLLNIPTQKYVLGSTYTPSTCEFIVCCFPNVEPSHCSITVDEKGEFFIENLLDFAKTFINGEPLRGLDPVKLNFGDSISLGTEMSTAAFVFEERNANDEDDLQIGKMIEQLGPVHFLPVIAYKVGSNELIVELILKHFSVKELKEYRFVSKVWNMAARPNLRKRCSVSIHQSSDPHEQTKLFRCSKEMGKNFGNMTSLSIEIPSLSKESAAGKQNAKKFEGDLFKYQFRDDWATLLYLKVKFDGTVFLLDKIFRKVSPTVQHLVIDSASATLGGSQETNCEFSPDWIFAKLTKLKILSLWGFNSTTQSQFARNILQKVNPSSLEKIELRGYSSYFLPALVEMNFSNLREISLKWVNEEDLISLANMSSILPLHNLTLDEIVSVASSKIGPNFSTVLEKFSKSLVSLTIRSHLQNVIFPVFKKLKVLNLFFYVTTSFTFNPNFLYSTHLPALESLTLKTSSLLQYCLGEVIIDSGYTKAEAVEQWRFNQGLFNTFIPTAGKGHPACLTLLQLNVPNCSQRCRDNNNAEEMSQEYDDRVREMKTLFPKVNAKWIQGEE